MFTEWQSHSKFKQLLVSRLMERYGVPGKQTIINYHLPNLAKVWLLDLSPAIPILQKCYSDSPRGKCPRDPLAMLRSFFVMGLVGCTDITKWVHRLKTQAILAILCGFTPGDTPGVGTYYDFIDRLWLSYLEKNRPKYHQFEAKPRKPGRKNKKLETPKHPGSVERCVNRISKYEKHPTRPAPYDIIMSLFKHCFVLPSANKGLLGDPKNLCLSGDGTSVRTGAGSFGKKICSCRKQGIYHCNCPRFFSDPDATWGWDSYREEYYYGRTLYEFVASDSPHDLPVYFQFVSAKRHDSIACVFALDRARRLFPELSFAELSLDSAHDAFAIYSLLDSWDITPIIAANPGNTSSDPKHEKYNLTSTGVPICKAGLPMVFNGRNPGRRRTKWRCPVASGKISICPLGTSCTSSSYGRVVYINYEENLRLFRAPPRDSKIWKKKYKKRTSSERSNKRKKIDYRLEQARVRSTKQWYFRTFLIAGLQHVDAWFKQYQKEVIPEILKALGKPPALTA